MIQVVAFKPEHLARIQLQEAQSDMAVIISMQGYGDAIAQAGNAYTLLDGETVIICAGAVEMWADRAMMWALLSKDAGQHMRHVHRAVSGFLAQCKWRRMEAYADSEFCQGNRWLAMLGFKHEGKMRAFGPDGRDFELYARVK